MFNNFLEARRKLRICLTRVYQKDKGNVFSVALINEKCVGEAQEELWMLMFRLDSAIRGAISLA